MLVSIPTWAGHGGMLQDTSCWLELLCQSPRVLLQQLMLFEALLLPPECRQMYFFRARKTEILVSLIIAIVDAVLFPPQHSKITSNLSPLATVSIYATIQQPEQCPCWLASCLLMQECRLCHNKVYKCSYFSHMHSFGNKPWDLSASHLFPYTLFFVVIFPAKITGF